jgi:hypothetical protein
VDPGRWERLSREVDDEQPTVRRSTERAKASLRPSDERASLLSPLPTGIFPWALAVDESFNRFKGVGSPLSTEMRTIRTASVGPCCSARSHLLSGDQASKGDGGVQSLCFKNGAESKRNCVNCLSGPPSEGISIAIVFNGSRDLRNAMWRPSGDQAGAKSFPSPVVRRMGSVEPISLT